MFSRVVNLALVIDVDTWASGVGLVEKRSSEWVLVALSDIVISEVDDVFTRNAVLEHDLHGVVRVSLMAVVLVGVGASHDDSPMVRGGS